MGPKSTSSNVGRKVRIYHGTRADQCVHAESWYPEHTGRVDDDIVLIGPMDDVLIEWILLVQGIPDRSGVQWMFMARP